MENKQTAVSQIFAQMKAGRKDTKFWNDTMVIDWLLEQEERYKQMEKEQIIKSYLDGDSNGCGCYDWSTEEQAEDYYKETYKEIK
jgi:hypothetical protein